MADNGELKKEEETIAIKDLVMAARMNDKNQIEVLVGPYTKDQLLHVRAILNDKVQDIIDYMKATAMQQKAEEERLRQTIAQKPGKMQDFVRRFKR